ncbi:Zona pellucida-binding protein 1 [Striga asiatica]|uniref:Zona pellucida-binding protein 1 n=1 Tax=Striga asiatica TaxID=4170 RepID=A0A5A7R7M9_STRAF|nr:Zona pellucida-binding protein 1 [Striga asiatica]
MPDCNNSVLTKLLERLSIVHMPRNKIHVRLNAHVYELLHHVLIELRVAGKVLRHQHFLDRPYAVHATLHVLRVAEVVEGDGRVIVHIGVEEGDLTFRTRARDFLEYEAALEGLAREASLLFAPKQFRDHNVYYQMTVQNHCLPQCTLQASRFTRHEYCVEGVIRHFLSHMLIIKNDWNTKFLELGFWANAAKKQKVRAPNRTRRDYDLTPNSIREIRFMHISFFVLECDSNCPRLFSCS